MPCTRKLLWEKFYDNDDGDLKSWERERQTPRRRKINKFLIFSFRRKSVIFIFFKQEHICVEFLIVEKSYFNEINSKILIIRILKIKFDQFHICCRRQRFQVAQVSIVCVCVLSNKFKTRWVIVWRDIREKLNLIFHQFGIWQLLIIVILVINFVIRNIPCNLFLRLENTGITS